MKNLSFILLLAFALTSCNQRQNEASPQKENEEAWIQLFNGKDLSGWTVKIRGYPSGENFGNTFRVVDGNLQVNYDAYNNEFKERFGHIYYTDKKFSHYKMLVEYRFIGEQLPDGEGWAYRNSGIMFHSQSPESMDLNQSFPNSIEAQILGGDGTNERTTGNVCSPGTQISINGEPYLDHCYSSKSKTYPGNEWASLEIIVLGDSIVHHVMEGDTILTYTNLLLENPEKTFTPLKEGFVSLQSESTPIEFRKVLLLDLSEQGR